MIEAVLWDFGGVVTESPFDGFARYERADALPAGLIRRINSTNPDENAWARLERNEVDVAQFAVLFEAEAAALGHSVDAEAVLACLSGQLRPQMVEAVRRLAGADAYRTAVLTNNLVSEDSPLATMDDVRHLFDVVVESSKVGVRKPEPRFYEIACEQLDVAPDRCVFLDDLGVNLKPARAMGMKTIKVVDPDVALGELQALVSIALRG